MAFLGKNWTKPIFCLMPVYVDQTCDFNAGADMVFALTPRQILVFIQHLNRTMLIQLKPKGKSLKPNTFLPWITESHTAYISQRLKWLSFQFGAMYGYLCKATVDLGRTLKSRKLPRFWILDSVATLLKKPPFKSQSSKKPLCNFCGKKCLLTI